jgi:putative acyl-CoA dehydrogenase
MNLFETDLALREAIEREHANWGVDRLTALGELAGSAEAREHADRAERNSPRLTGDGTVECDPGWHWMLETAVAHEIPTLPWQDPRPGAQVVRVALGYLWGQVNTGVMCPMIMTFAAIPVLRRFGGERWVPRLLDGALAGQAYTEQQGGSDLRTTRTVAKPLGDGSYELWGDKWFCSAPMCDVFLTLAQTDDGLSCFLIERAEGFNVVRLKDKLGTRALPTAEVELRGVRGWLLGEQGRGLTPVVHNIGHARLGPAAVPEMRAALVAAIEHTRQRTAFGARLADQPAMLNVLADLALDCEAGTVTMIRMARAYEEYDSPFRRLATTVNEYWGCARVTAHVAESMQCLGGNGYTEPSGLPRLLRDAAVHPIWEGSGNVVALDVLRAMAKEPDSVDAFLAECALARGGNQHLDQHLDGLKLTADDPQFAARRLAEDLALALQASLLVRHSPAFVADAFCSARLAPDRGRNYGTLPSGVDAKAIVERAYPA